MNTHYKKCHNLKNAQSEEKYPEVKKHITFSPCDYLLKEVQVELRTYNSISTRFTIKN